MEISKEFIYKSKVISGGTTSYIMQHETGVVYKLYKSTIGYILRNDKYGVNEKETLDRLNYIISRKAHVSLTDLPNELLTYGGKPIGVGINYYKDSITLKEFLSGDFDADYTLIKSEVINIVNELIENGIVPTDPHFENFLITFNDKGDYKIHMIDVDDIYVSVYPDSVKDVWYESEVETCHRVIDLSFQELENNKRL